jgi:hypothetical protein
VILVTLLYRELAVETRVYNHTFVLCVDNLHVHCCEEQKEPSYCQWLTIVKAVQSCYFTKNWLCSCGTFVPTHPNTIHTQAEGNSAYIKFV